MLLNLPRSDQKKGGRSKCVELILIRLGSYRIYEKTQLTHVHCRNIRIVLKKQTHPGGIKKKIAIDIDFLPALLTSISIPSGYRHFTALQNPVISSVFSKSQGT
jgi:hypothetical protein